LSKLDPSHTLRANPLPPSATYASKSEPADLATLRKALRYAWRTHKLISKVRVVDLYKQSEGAERACEYVYTVNEYHAWLKGALEPLRSASVLAYECGICRGEMLALQRDCVLLRESPDENGEWGTIEIKRGLKRDARRRAVSITEPMAAVLLNLLSQSKCEYVFSGPEDHKKKALRQHAGKSTPHHQEDLQLSS